MKGSKNKAHLPPRPSFFWTGESEVPFSCAVAFEWLLAKASASFSLHLTRDLSIFKKAIPIMRMMKEATRLKIPSHICSVLAHKSTSLV